MDITDREVIERIERLAFQAGVAARGTTEKPAEKPEEDAIVKKLRNIGKTYTRNTGTALFGASVAENIEWSELIEWANK
jgi:hypothetical protein